uniref:Polar amino acid transport system permease protein n=1 Tax=Candidatus Kentrum sp. MB TaxID=2138164 RepID=A0A451B7H9_9GAMM|nr:MAG: polar amino acid transport system permease protein [Candidatus Kentron sp. MB]VFK28415.1 MAG: polar amino acid transport system permease protein [Candidatus Kentron sp. MB]VFK74245.1 MAG: polar amino acid transport system permease protein [Candidatus Kentron sp. MB]
MAYELDFSGLAPYWPAFIRGTIVTVELAVYSSVLGTMAGIPLAALARLKGFAGIVVLWLIDILRAIPNLVLMFFFFYFPYREIFGGTGLSPFTSAMIGLVVAQAAYSADLIRAAIDQIPRAQSLGLRALGYKEYQIWMDLSVPSVVRQTLVPHVALWIGNLKLSSLASVLGVEDVVFVAKVAMSQSFRSLEAWLVVAAVFVVLVLPVTFLLRRIERSAFIRRQ